MLEAMRKVYFILSDLSDHLGLSSNEETVEQQLIELDQLLEQLESGNIK